MSSKPTIERFISEFETKLRWHNTFYNPKNLAYNIPVDEIKK
ncbi:hypothetical protein [Seonamhaeicola sp. NFXS20]